ncbi:hypothetical protein RGCCGE502_20770 [Rhizobium grahamii CCGE 502]|uniref:Uncharacterized protein n=1 Tax=Rhizobium grahamii CCGE 502 TaxID=990285 RepID=S3IAP5_9HYPH|nr:hypothetical protein RGCCGE502_20770 [Rhizobium grahamii CCGE 502]
MIKGGREETIIWKGSFVNKSLGARQRLFVKSRNGKAVYESVKVRIRDCSIDVSITFRQYAGNVIGSKHDFDRAPASHEAREPDHRVSSWHRANADLKLTEHRLLGACEADIAGKSELAARAPSAAPDRCD